MTKLTARKLAQNVGMLSTDEVELIKKCMRQIQDDNPIIINIGASVGTSVIAMLEVKPKAFIFSVDKKTCKTERENLVKARLPANRVVRILGDSGQVGKFWPYGDYDLIFIDGAHHSTAVIEDIKRWKPKLKPGGFILFHDYNHPKLPELKKIVDEKMEGWQVVGRARYLIAFQGE